MRATESIAGRRVMLSVCVMAFLVLGIGALSWAQGVPWRDNAPPYDFLFGNHIDSHQQSKLVGGELKGFLYITYTGVNQNDGIPTAMHCESTTPASECVVGWRFSGKPIDPEDEASWPTFVFHENDHPIWLVNTRNDIPQPGAYGLFHWLDGPPNAADLLEGDRFPGYFLELFALRTFYFEHGGQMILVKPGLDIATHVNIVGSFPGF